MRLQDSLRIDSLIVEKPVSRQRVTPTVAGRIHTCLRIGAQCLDDAFAAPVQTLVSQINSLKFRGDSLAH